MGNNTPEEQNPHVSRRLFLKSMLTGSAIFLLEQIHQHPVVRTLAAASQAPARLPTFKPVYAPGNGFPQSVASGDPTDSGAMIWTRVDPAITQGVRRTALDPKLVRWITQPQSPPSDPPWIREAVQAGQFAMFEVSRSDDFQHPVLVGFTPIWGEFDHVVKVDLDGYLQPQTSYFYRFITHTGHVSQTGHFRTLPASHTDVPAVTFAFITCQDYTNGYFNAIRFLTDEALDFVVHLGDYVYEAVGDPRYQNPLPERQITLPSHGAKAVSLDDYRTLYRTYRSDPDLQKLHETHAMIAIWDDHEFANDCYYPAVAPDDNLNSDPPRRLAANQVWFEYMPARVSFDRTKGFENSIRIYRHFKIGRLAELIMTDERLYRRAHPCGEGQLFERYFSRGCSEMYNPGQTMLGARQKEWFLNRMQQSTAIWKIWGNEVQFAPLKVLRRYLNLDAWDGYAGERQSIAQVLKTAGVQNIITLTGDLHSFEVNLMKADYGKDRDSNAIGVELMVGSVSSSNLQEMISNLLTGKLSKSSPIADASLQKIMETMIADSSRESRLLSDTSRKKVSEILKQPLTKRSRTLSSTLLERLVKELANALSYLVIKENPWIKRFNSTRHGYCVLKLTPQAATCTAYSVSTIKSRQASRSLLWQCEIPRDQATVRMLNG